MNSTNLDGNKIFKVNFTYIVKGTKREVYMTKEISGTNIEEVALKLEKSYNKVKIESHTIIG
jgi:hypothetical protein